MAAVTVLFGSDRVGEYKVTHVPFVVGRDASCEVTIDNAGISREHCRVLYDGRRFYIEDMGSANGIFVHGHKTRKTSISDGDEVKMGKYSLLFNHSSREATPEPMHEGPGGSPFAEAEKSRTSDPMMTFKMDAREIEAQMTRPRDQGGAHRASDVARSFAGGGSGRASNVKVQVFRAGRRSFAGKVFRFLALVFLLAIVGLAAFLVLQYYGIASL